jgi:hypothetical protein
MDAPTRAILFSFLIFAIVVIVVKFWRRFRSRAFGIALLWALLTWLYLSICGEIVYHWTNSGVCSPYLGCGSGFFGYDAFQHLFSGILIAFTIIWLCTRFPKYSVLHSKPWKTALTVIAIAALIAVLWEVAECAHDMYRIAILHEDLLNYKLHINLLDQPTNLDTMGDLCFNIAGSIIGFFIYEFLA